MPILSKKTKALLLGCNDYSCAPLNWCVKDCERVTLSLINNGVEPRNITALFDENLTYEKTLNTLTEFIKNNEEGFIYYSGHGTTDSKNNSCLVMQDACADESALIRIDTLFNLAKKKRFVFIFDCCYSHDETLGYIVGTENKNRSFPLFQKKAKKPKKFIVKNSSCVFLFSSTNKQVSNEGIVEVVNNEKIGSGFFTYSVVNNFNKPINIIHNNTVDYLSKYSVGQTPVFISRILDSNKTIL